MARDGHSEVDVTSPGISSGPPAKGGWVQNAFWRKGAWEVRKGFGQMGQWDTSLSSSRSGPAIDDEDLGLEKQLGAYVIKETFFGHTQVVSVWKAKVITSRMAMRGRRQPVFVVFIYDVTTNVMWEEVIYRHTSQTTADGSSTASGWGALVWWSKGANQPSRHDMSKWRANYETNYDEDYQSWNSGADTDWWFCWFRDSLYMGAEGVPPMIYSPIDPWRRRDQQCNKALSNNLAPRYGESSTLAWAGPVEGITPETLPYMSSSQLPWFSAAAPIGNFIAAARDYNVWFSLNGQPFIFGGDVITLTERVKALFPQGNALLIFTESKTYLLQPGSPMLSGGQLITLSESIGCAGNGAVTQIGRTGQSVAWADKTGIHTTSGGLQIRTISEGVDNFFSSFLEDPLTSYFVNDGHTAVANTQPRSISRFNQDGVNLTYSPSLDILLATFPDSGVSLCYSEDRWSLWTTTSRASGLAAYAIENIVRPFYCASNDDLFLVGGIERQAVLDSASNHNAGGSPISVGANIDVASAYFLRYGRGGAIDRSIRDEDDRIGCLKITLPHGAAAGATSKSSLLLFDTPIKMPVGYEFRLGNTLYFTVTAAQDCFLVPIKISIAQLLTGASAVLYGIDEIHITFQFDNLMWEPLFVDAAEIFPIAPSERLGSLSGWITGPDVDVSEMRVYDGMGGGAVPSSSGNTAELHFTGSNVVIGANQWTHHPKMNVPVDQMTTLLYLPFRRKSAELAKSVSCLGISNATCTYDVATSAGAKTADILVTDQYSLGSETLHSEDDVAQAVDWTIKSPPLALQEGILVQGRGLFILIDSRGLADDADLLAPGTPAGLMNLISAADGKEWVGQVIDTSSTNPVPALLNTTNKQTVLERVEYATGVTRPLYGDTEVTYGNSAVPATGTYICGSIEIDIIQVSEAQKGESIAWMLYGYMRARGQGLRIESVKAEVIKAGERRRYKR